MAYALHGWWSYGAIPARVTGGWAAHKSTSASHATRAVRRDMCLPARADATCINEAVVLAYSDRRPDWAKAMIAQAGSWSDVATTFLNLTATAMRKSSFWSFNSIRRLQRKADRV